MAGFKYLYIPLENATLVQRKHGREVVPPGMVTLKNFISSRSDNVPTLRPDIKDDSTIEVKAYRTLLGDCTSLIAVDEYLNSAFGLYGGDNLIYLTSRFPIDNSDDVKFGTYSGIEYSTIISKVVDSGTATAHFNDNSENVAISDSAQINMNQKAWYGACLLIDGDTTYYPIRLVTDKSNVVLESLSDVDNSTAAFSVIQSHCPANDGYKFHTELFLSNSIYNTPIFDNPFSTQRMSGPFVGNITTQTDFIEYTGTFTEFTEAESTSFQSQWVDGWGEYDGESLNKKFGATGLGIYMCTKPFYEKWSVDGNGDPVAITNAGPYYTVTPEITSSYLPPIDGGAGDIFSILPLETDYTEFYNRSFSNGPIIFNGTNKFYIPVVVYGADVGGGGPDYSVAIIEFLDDSTPTTVGYLTDFSIGADLPANGFYFTNMCWNGTDNTIWISISDSDAGVTIDDRIVVVETATWTTTTLTMPDQILCYGLEYSESAGTTGGVLATGQDADVGSEQNGIAMFYDLDANTWTTLTNPSGDPLFYGCGIYDDTDHWVFTITGKDDGTSEYKLYYWGENDSTTIVDTGSTFSSDLAAGAFRVASNTFIYDPTGTPKYSNVVVLSGHDKVGIVEVDADTASISFVKLIDDNFSEWNSTYIGKFQRPVFYIDGAQRYVISNTVGDGTEVSFSHGVSLIDASPGNYVNYYVDEFTAISDLYRSKAYGIVNGYVVLFGLLEYDAVDDEWDYTPRRIRWTAPATVNDFSGTGSGTADVLGNGEFIDARTVNERIVMFESNAISTLVPRGIVEDPFDYEVIHRGIRIASNPCVVNDIVYFLADDGLLYSSNGITVEELGASFDLTVFDDFIDKKPAWLVYSIELNSLLIFYPDSTTQTVYAISLANGSVCSWNVYDYNDVYPLKSVVAVESSSNISTYLAYNPRASNETYDEVCAISVLKTGDAITGEDNITKENINGFWYAEIETGNLYHDELPEGIKFALKHIIVHTYTNSTLVTYNPDIIIEVKSIEDSSWSSASDQLLSSALTISAATAAINSSTPPSALSDILGTANGTAVTYNLPWVAANCRIYTKNGTTYTACTLVTTTPDAANEYQITATKQIKVYGTNGHVVYCFCENEPFIKTGTGDYVETTGGLQRIIAISNYLSSTLYDSNLGGLTGSHVYAEQIPIGSGTVKVGINKLIEGAKIRIRVVPRAGSVDAPTIVKITGISLGYIPLGEKILEATGG